MVAGRVRDAIRCEEARMSRYGSTKSVSRVRKWRSRPRGVDLSVIWRLIFARNDAESKSDWLPADWVETHLESPNRDCVDELVARNDRRRRG